METLKTKTTLSASELRIGNWLHEKWEKETVLGGEVYALSEDAYVKVESISYDHLLKDMLPDSYSVNNSDLSFFQPIPLSPDILLSAGFKYLKEEGVSSFEEFHNPDEDTHCWSFNVKSTDLIDSHEICLVKWGEEEYFTFQLGRGTYRKKIKYLHELQNGMFFLTGDELTININQ